MNQRQTSGPLVSCPGRFPELAIILSSEENVLLEFITGRAGHRKGHSSTAPEVQGGEEAARTIWNGWSGDWISYRHFIF